MNITIYSWRNHLGAIHDPQPSGAMDSGVLAVVVALCSATAESIPELSPHVKLAPEPADMYAAGGAVITTRSHADSAIGSPYNEITQTGSAIITAIELRWNMSSCA